MSTRRVFLIFTAITAVAALTMGCVLAAEHAGKKAEHGGQPSAKNDEHAGQAAPVAKTNFTAEDIKSAMQTHIDKALKAGNGVLQIKDEKTKEVLKLKFVKIHDPVRKIEGQGYFACTDFHPEGMPEKLYDLDFWLNPKGDTLAITKTRIHKHPVMVKGQWTKKERYTFINDNPVEVQ